MLGDVPQQQDDEVEEVVQAEDFFGLEHIQDQVLG